MKELKINFENLPEIFIDNSKQYQFYKSFSKMAFLRKSLIGVRIPPSSPESSESLLSDSSVF